MNKQYKTSIKIINKLHEKGYKAYLVGGCVRDMILGVESKDYDIVTNAKPEDIIKLFKRTVKVGIQFGVIKVIENRFDFEVATFRKDGDYFDGRRPQTIDFSDEKEDVYRRDFTINGLLYDPINNNIIDYVGGKEDIKHKIIKTIGDPEKRFEEDYLRIIRAIRFASKYNFDIEENTRQALFKLVHKIVNVSKERINDELTKMFNDTNRDIAVLYLIETNILKYIFPGIFKYISMKKNINITRNIMVELRNDLNFVSTVALLFTLRIFYRDYNITGITDIMIDNIIDKLKELKLSNAEITNIKEIIRVINELWNIKNLSLWQVKRLLRSPYIKLCMKINKEINIKMNLNYDDIVSSFYQKYDKYKDNLYHETLIGGSDLIKLGYKPGKIFSEILFDIENKQLEAIISTKDEALEYIHKTYPNIE